MDHLVVFQPSGRQGRVPAGTSLLGAARQLGVDLDSICGGRQTCGKCKVLVEDGSFAKHAVESSAAHLSPVEAAERDYVARHAAAFPAGARLGCAACVTGDVVISVPPESQAHRQIIRKSATERPVALNPALRQVFVTVEEHRLGERLGDWERLQDALRREWGLDVLRIDLHALRRLGPALAQGKHQVTAVIWGEAEVIDVRPGYEEGIYGLAVDVGSTTVAGHLCDLASGAILATEALMNPQVTFGEDLMSRVSYAMLHDDGLAKMQQAIIGALNRLAGLAAHVAGLRARDIHELVLVGNTVMHHIMLGLDPTPLGGAPFTLATHAPLDIKARELGLKLHPAANVHFLALEAGHVGSDNVGVLIAEAPDQQDELTLVIDVGTNAEVLLGNRDGVLSCSSPTGPAFEGAQIAHGQRAAPGAIERVRVDPATGEPRFRVIGHEAWSDELEPGAIGATGICGSGIIEVVAELFVAGIVRPDGRFDPEWRPRQGDRETRRQGDQETGRPGDRETRRQGDQETGRPGDRETRRQGDQETGRPGDQQQRFERAQRAALLVSGSPRRAQRAGLLVSDGALAPRRPARRVCAGHGRPDGHGPRDRCHPGRRAQHPACQGRALRGLQAADAPPWRREGRPHCAGRCVRQLHRPAAGYGARPLPRL